MVTIRDTRNRLGHLWRLELAGVEQPSPPDLGPSAILWTRKRGGEENWEVLPKWVADLVISDLHNDGTVERAAIYYRIPENAPMDVAREWLKARMGKPAPMPNVILAA